MLNLRHFHKSNDGSDSVVEAQCSLGFSAPHFRSQISDVLGDIGELLDHEQLEEQEEIGVERTSSGESHFEFTDLGDRQTRSSVCSAGPSSRQDV